MKSFKLFIFTGAALVIFAVLAGCASFTVVGIDGESVIGPERVRQYGTINPNDITVYAFYKDDSRKKVTLSRSNITFDSSRAGPQTVTVKVSGFETSFQTQVMALTGISVTSQSPTVKLGAANAGISTLEIQGTWNQMGSEKIPTSECQLSTINTQRAGVQTITVTWNGQQTTFNLNVVEMQTLRLAANPTKTTYYQGEPLDLAGMRAVGVWPGLPEENLNIALSDVSGYNTQTVGRQTLTVSKNGKTATFTVTVQPLIGILNGTWKGSGGLTDNQTWTFNNGVFSVSYIVTAGLESLIGTTRTIRGTYTITPGIPTDRTFVNSGTGGVNNNYGAVAFTSENVEDQNLLYQWLNFSIDTDPTSGPGYGDRVRGTVITAFASRGPGTGSYRFQFVKQ